MGTVAAPGPLRVAGARTAPRRGRTHRGGRGGGRGAQADGDSVGESDGLVLGLVLGLIVGDVLGLVDGLALGWFAQQLDSSAVIETEHVDLSHLSIGLMSFSEVSDSVADSLANLSSMVVTAGGVVVVPTNSTLLRSASFLSALRITSGVNPSLDYSQRVEQAGFHVMDTPTGNAVETLAGLGGTGVQVMLAYVQKSPLQAHPLIPLIQCGSVGDLNDMDVVLDLKEAFKLVVGGECLLIFP